MEPEQEATLGLIRQVLGEWHGSGTAKFATIPTFEYQGTISFEANDVQPYLRFEERNRKKLPTGEFVPSHWETGFWRVLASGEVEVVSAQGGGRVEVLRGMAESRANGFCIELFSTLLGNDPRVIKSVRRYVLENQILEYSMQMSTTSVPELGLHVHVRLSREAMPSRLSELA